ncbi:shikimate kinase [uncultured Maribacter sp.]|uniref:shikimate kinase n=1 Tax=uncultured Maribacter sp. TaxID=431308 RepID=UPI002610A667|nr:shikimate kinase [uncultured Maribacter sp.]
MKIVLVGYMGSGKTTVGKLLAKNKNLNFIDLDEYIEESEGKTIPEIFEQKGEIYFRKKEFHYLQEVLLYKDNVVLSTGGGTPCYTGNMEVMLSATENVFYIKVGISELVSRLSLEKEHRPLIKNISDKEMPEFIGKHMFERSYFYTKAHHTINVHNNTVSEVVESISDVLV